MSVSTGVQAKVKMERNVHKVTLLKKKRRGV